MSLFQVKIQVIEMSAQLTRNSKKDAGRILETEGVKKRIRMLYDKHEYLEAYSRHTDFRVGLDPERAVGGMWEEIGRLQFVFLVEKGLQPHHEMLDIGCGTLRGGRHFRIPE